MEWSEPEAGASAGSVASGCDARAIVERSGRCVAIAGGPPHHAASQQQAREPAEPGSKGEQAMAESVYKIIELVGTSTESWEKAATAAVNQASKSLRDLRIAEIVQLDMHVQNGKIAAYRAKVKVSFKFERGKG
jgi:dodecin